MSPKKGKPSKGKPGGKVPRKAKAAMIAVEEESAGIPLRNGDRVSLLHSLGGFPPGSEGFIASVNTDGTFAVTIDREADCSATLFPLPPQKREYFSPITKCPPPA